MRLRRRSPGWLTLALFTAALHVSTAVAVPLVHAQVEVFQSAQDIEASHTDQCPRLHAEGICVVCPSFDLTGSTTAAVDDALPHDRSHGVTAGAVRPQDTKSPSHPVRAPPPR